MPQPNHYATPPRHRVQKGHGSSRSAPNDATTSLKLQPNRSGGSSRRRTGLTPSLDINETPTPYRYMTRSAARRKEAENSQQNKRGNNEPPQSHIVPPDAPRSQEKSSTRKNNERRGSEGRATSSGRKEKGRSADTEVRERLQRVNVEKADSPSPEPCVNVNTVEHEKSQGREGSHSVRFEDGAKSFQNLGKEFASSGLEILPSPCDETSGVGGCLLTFMEGPLGSNLLKPKPPEQGQTKNHPKQTSVAKPSAEQRPVTRDCLLVSSTHNDSHEGMITIRKAAARLSVFLGHILAFEEDNEFAFGRQNSTTSIGTLCSSTPGGDYPEEEESYSLPFSLSALKLVKTFLEFHENVPAPVLPKPLPSHGLGADGMLQLEIPSHDVVLVFGLKGRDLFELLEAADYMQIEPLFELVSCRIAWEWKQKSLEDLEYIAVFMQHIEEQGGVMPTLSNLDRKPVNKKFRQSSRKKGPAKTHQEDESMERGSTSSSCGNPSASDDNIFVGTPGNFHSPTLDVNRMAEISGVSAGNSSSSATSAERRATRGGDTPIGYGLPEGNIHCHFVVFQHVRRLF
eukprot:Selendium_serpulae@DN5579_c0_g1_i2.p1